MNLTTISSTFKKPKLLSVLACSIMCLVGCQSHTLAPYSLSLKDAVVNSDELDFHGQIPNCEKWNRHVIAMNYRGEFKPIKFEDCDGKDSKWSPEPHSNTHIKNIIADFKKSCKKQLLVFIHGGVNDYKESLKRMKRDLLSIIKDRRDVYPVFILWPSELFDSYGDSVTNYSQGAWWGFHPMRYEGIPEIAIDFATDLAEIPIRAPKSYLKQANLWWNARCLNESHRDNFIVSGYCKPKNHEPSAYERNPSHDPCGEEKDKRPAGYTCIYSRDNDETKTKDLAYDFDFNIKRLGNYAVWPIKILTTPIVDPLGYRDWYSMISRARFAMRKPCRDHYQGEGSCENGLVSQFFEQLDVAIAGSEKEITLIGHSMGAIVASEIVASFPDLPYSDVVFIGAAVSIREFKKTVLYELKRRVNSKTCEQKKNDSCPDAGQKGHPFQFYNLSLHPYAEATEESAWGSMPSGSLLEWIDINFTSPADVADRSLGRWVNVASVVPEFQEETKNLLGKYVIFKRFGLDENSPHTHGGLANPEEHGCYWQKKYWREMGYHCTGEKSI